MKPMAKDSLRCSKYFCNGFLISSEKQTLFVQEETKSYTRICDINPLPDDKF